MTPTLSPGAIVAHAWDTYKRNASVLLPPAAVLFGVQLLVALVLPTRAAAIILILFTILGLLYQGFVVEVAAADEAGRPSTDIAGLIRVVTPVLGPLIAVSILFAIGVAIGFVLIIVPALYLITIWSVVIPVTVLERPGVIAAFGRSRALVKGNGWNVFGVIVLVFVLFFIIGFFVGVVFSGLGHTGRDILQWVFQVLVAPLEALIVTAIYFGLRPTDSGLTADPAAGGPSPSDVAAAWAAPIPSDPTPPASTPPNPTPPPASSGPSTFEQTAFPAARAFDGDPPAAGGPAAAAHGPADPPPLAPPPARDALPPYEPSFGPVDTSRSVPPPGGG